VFGAGSGASAWVVPHWVHSQPGVAAAAPIRTTGVPGSGHRIGRGLPERDAERAFLARDHQRQRQVHGDPAPAWPGHVARGYGFGFRAGDDRSGCAAHELPVLRGRGGGVRARQDGGCLPGHGG